LNKALCRSVSVATSLRVLFPCCANLCSSCFSFISIILAFESSCSFFRITCSVFIFSWFTFSWSIVRAEVSFKILLNSSKPLELFLSTAPNPVYNSLAISLYVSSVSSVSAKYVLADFITDSSSFTNFWVDWSLLAI
jgi:hypothetical protein